MQKTTLAIDFGTSNSLVGAYRPISDSTFERIEALKLDPSAKDPSLMRTLLYFQDANTCFYGSEAVHKFIENDMEGRLFRSFKSQLPNKNYLGSTIGNRILPLENMIGIFLLELKHRSEKILGTPAKRAVIGRPARYAMDDVADGFALHRMKKAADFAGFEEVLFLPEPLAAALEFRRQLKEEKIVLICDFGGGTSDFTLMRMTPQAFQKKDVLAIEGCPLSGDALESVLMSHRLNENFGAKAKYRLPMSSNLLTMPKSVMECLNKPSHIAHLKEPATYHFIKEVQKCAPKDKDKEAIERLFILMEDQQIFPFFEKIEQTKRQLSDSDQAHFSFDYPGIEIEDDFSRQDFERWSQSIKTEIFKALDLCLLNAQIQAQDVDQVFLTGGTAYVPFIRQELEHRFGISKLSTKSFFHSVLSGLIESAKDWDILQEMLG